MMKHAVAFAGLLLLFLGPSAQAANSPAASGLMDILYQRD
jgi:hypothetical protein